MSYEEQSGFSRRELFNRGAAVGAGILAANNVALAAAGEPAEKSRKENHRLCVAACQILTYPDIEKSTQKILGWIEVAAKDGVDVVAFPEASVCGYACDPEYWKNANPADFENAERQVIEASKRLNIAVILGTAHWEDGVLYNSLLVIDKGGVVRGRYSKTHLAEGWPAPGKILPVYMVAGVESCFIICHDVRYPELVRLGAIAGAQICYYCSNESPLLRQDKLSAYNAMPIARATENSIFCVMTNAPANPDDMHSPSQSHGNSKIINPGGNVLEEAGYFEERLVTVSINLKEASRRIAERAANDPTVVRQWMQEGAKLVVKPDACGTM